MIVVGMVTKAVFGDVYDGRNGRNGDGGSDSNALDGYILSTRGLSVFVSWKLLCSFYSFSVMYLPYHVLLQFLYQVFRHFFCHVYFYNFTTMYFYNFLSCTSIISCYVRLQFSIKVSIISLSCYKISWGTSFTIIFTVSVYCFLVKNIDSLHVIYVYSSRLNSLLIIKFSRFHNFPVMWSLIIMSLSYSLSYSLPWSVKTVLNSLQSIFQRLVCRQDSRQ